MEGTHTPLSVWFWTAYLVASQTPGISAVQFQRQLGLSRYETAFQTLHKLRAGMVRPDQDRIGGKPGEHVEADETWVGGRTRGEGRGVHHKTLVAAAVEVRQRKPKTKLNMRLASVPTVLKMMNDHLDWTTQLGDAFLAKPAEVMAVIQALRKRAMDAGYLKDTPEQQIDARTVSTEQTAAAATPAVLTKEVITIKPAKSDTIYVPQYNPEVVYQAPMAPPPTGYPATTVVNVNAGTSAPSYYPATTTTTSNDSWVNFATGTVVGGLLTWGIMEWADDDDWDGYYVGHYHGNTVVTAVTVGTEADITAIVVTSTITIMSIFRATKSMSIVIVSSNKTI